MTSTSLAEKIKEKSTIVIKEPVQFRRNSAKNFITGIVKLPEAGQLDKFLDGLRYFDFITDIEIITVTEEEIK